MNTHNRSARQSATTSPLPAANSRSPRGPLKPPASISPNPRQPRTVFDEDALNELIASIKEIGILQPPVVRKVSEGRYELVMGERRFRAAKAAGLTSIPVIIRQTPDNELLREALIENIHRSQLNPLEEAAAYAGLLISLLN